MRFIVDRLESRADKLHIVRSGPRCIKLTINDKLDFNGNFHRTLDADWLWCLVAMVVTIESKVTINGKFYTTGPRSDKTDQIRATCLCLYEHCTTA